MDAVAIRASYDALCSAMTAKGSVPRGTGVNFSLDSVTRIFQKKLFTKNPRE
jgi:hypothetical protein